ncbi:hypothetical protein Moror_2588 [Moniliophthora roreri MCA 2997]|uniref:Uncharacterized protein n=2 Tax=Moniliophthora roreri TaxID=221103 RepID=V2YIL2_MONRO|nr:hypothetical protein Moror_2588 [Moniliophthora roreri MCA 2997]KAI3619333.1 hypothetical protein WG66_013007 [Moniliophthora roreri]
MSDKPQNFGETLSSGIQDISALLPLLGTEQCEQNVGSALEKGYLYAAVASLSLFGSLGVVKAAFATLFATITWPFHGGLWLNNAGFATSGSVSSMVTIDKDTGMYVAEIKLRKLLEAQNIEDFRLLSEIQWSGQKYAKDSSYNAAEAMRRLNEQDRDMGGARFSRYLREIQRDITCWDFKELVRDLKGMGRRLTFKFQHAIKMGHEIFPNSWNALLIMTSALSALLSVTPYIYLASSHWSHPLSWIYPALRSFGSFLCVVCVQLALQTRIHQIANMCLAWMKIRQSHENLDEEIKRGKADKLEERIRRHTQLPGTATVGIRWWSIQWWSIQWWAIRRWSIQWWAIRRWAIRWWAKWANRDSPSVIEEGRHEDNGQHMGLSAEQQEVAALLNFSPMLIVYQLLIAAGMAMIVAGYVGCFSIVSQSDLPPSGPYIWFVMETVLSMLRIFLWGVNPSWDEHMEWTLTFQQHNNASFPLITSPNNSEELGFGGNAPAAKRPFLVYAHREFLSMAQAQIGQLQPPEAEGVTLYYGLIMHKAFVSSEHSHVDSDWRKYLSITMVHPSSEHRIFTFLCHGPDGDHPKLFLSTLETLSDTGVHHVSLECLWSAQEFDGFLWSHEFRSIVQYAQNLSTCLFAKYQELHLRWDFQTSQTIYQNLGINGAPLSEHDRDYISLQKLHESMATALQSRLHTGRNEQGKIDADQDKLFHLEALNIVETALLEVYLWDRESEFIDGWRQKENFKLQLLPDECMHAMQARISVQKNSALLRCGGEQLAVQFADAWDHLLAKLEKLRKDAPKDSDLSIRRARELWENIQTGDALGAIEELCSGLLPPLIHGVLTQVDEELQEELRHFLLTTFPDPMLPIPSRPYIYITNIWALKHIQNICALEIQVGNFQRSLSEYLNLVTYSKLAGQKMTTLIIYEPWMISDTTREAVTEHILKNPNILCLSGMGCHDPGTLNALDCKQPHCKAVFANQQKWKEMVQGRSDFVFRVGFEGRYQGVIVAEGDHIQVYHTGRCLVLFHCPNAGELTVTLSMCKRSVSVGLEATLQSDFNKRSNFTQTYTVPAFQNEGDLEHVTFLFSDVPKGTCAIAIHYSSVSFWWEIHGLVKVQWNAIRRTENDTGTDGDGPVSLASHSQGMSKRALSDMEEAKEQDPRNEQEIQRDAVMVKDLDDQEVQSRAEVHQRRAKKV